MKMFAIIEANHFDPRRRDKKCEKGIEQMNLSTIIINVNNYTSYMSVALQTTGA